MTTARNQELRIEGLEPFDVTEFRVTEAMNAPFSVELHVVTADANLDLDALIGATAAFEMSGAAARGGVTSRVFRGLVVDVEQLRAELTSLSTYVVCIAPVAWWMNQGATYRFFQGKTAPEAAVAVLETWPLTVDAGLLRHEYLPLELQTQYGESDLAFVSRVLEGAGISYVFSSDPGRDELLLDDRPHVREELATLPYVDDASARGMHAFATRLSIRRRARPARFTLRDHDHRLAVGYVSEAGAADPSSAGEAQIERFRYEPGAFSRAVTPAPGDTPIADDRGAFRTHPAEAKALAARRLAALRHDARVVQFETDAVDVAPGAVVRVEGHPHGDTRERLLVVSVRRRGVANGEWTHVVEAVRADTVYRPELKTPRPHARGVECATVTGPAGEELHTDEFGRVRVQFHWDRRDDRSPPEPIWLHVSQGWAGAGFGMIHLPRVGQEVLVSYLGGDPDRPLVTGRVYTALHKVPFPLPENKTQSGWRSQSTNGTGGYNEIMFEDRAGKELLRVQAERDLSTTVKHDEKRGVARDRETTIGRDDRTTVTKNLDKTILGNEHEVTGGNRVRVIGLNENVEVGKKAALTVVDGYSIVVGDPDGEHTALSMSPDRIVLSTSKGAVLKLLDEIATLDAEQAYVSTKDYFQAKSEGSASVTAANKLTVRSDETVIMGDQDVVVAGKDALYLSSGENVSIKGSDMVTISGGSFATMSADVVAMNGPGLPAARLGDPTPSFVIGNGSASVHIGGSGLPFSTKVLPNGDIQVGSAITISGTPAFQALALARIGVVGDTNSGRVVLERIEASGKKLRMTRHAGGNSSAGPATTQGFIDSTAKGLPVFDGGQTPILAPDGTQAIGTGKGSDVELELDPNLRLDNDIDPSRPPNDAVLFHEFSHAERQMRGEADNAPNMIFGGNDEELAIATANPSEADYLQERGYPFRRLDHDETWEAYP